MGIGGGVRKGHPGPAHPQPLRAANGVMNGDGLAESFSSAGWGDRPGGLLGLEQSTTLGVIMLHYYSWEMH